MLPVLNNKTTDNVSLAISIDEVARQCRIDESELGDPDIVASLETAILSAQGYLEANYNLSFGLNDFTAVFETTTYANRLHLPIAKTDNIKNVKTEKGTQIKYSFYKSQTHCFIDLDSPVTKNEKIIVDYTAGFANNDSIPMPVKTSLLLLTAHYYDVRNPETNESTNLSNFTIASLMLPYKKANI